MAAPSGIVWGSIAGDYGRIGIYVKLTNTATKTTRHIEIWFWSKYSVSDSSNTFYYNDNATSATTSKGAVNINTTVDSGGWSTSNQKKIAEYDYEFTRGTSASTRPVAAKLTGIDRVGATMTASTSYTIPALASYAVKYNANGGTGAPSAQTKWYGKTLTLSSTKPTRTGYTFQGWATSASGSVAYAAGASYTANAAVTLYAVWKANTYTITYNANGGSNAPSNQTKTYGKSLTLSSTKPTRTGYTFQGWATSASGSVAYAAGASYTANAAVTLYAVWKANTYTITYNANGGTLGSVNTQTKTHGQDLKLTGTATRTNYTFKGWATSAGGSVAYAVGANYTANAAVTLYAVWELDYEKPKITSFSVSRCNSNGAASDALVKFNWETSKANPTALIEWKATTDTNWNEKPITLSGNSGSVNEVIGSGALSVEKNYSIKVTVTDSVDSSNTSKNLPGENFPIDFLAGGKGTAVGKPAEIADTFDVGYKSRFRKEVSIGEKSGYHDGKTGVYIDEEGYIHIQRDSSQGFHPYLGFYIDDATAANGQIRLNSSTGQMEFLSAAGYKFGNIVYMPAGAYIGDKTAYGDGKTGALLHSDGYMHLQRDDGDPYIGFWRDNETGWTVGKCATLNLKDDGFLHFTTSPISVDKEAYFTGNIYSIANIRFDPNSTGKQNHYIGAQWADGNHHYLLQRGEDGLTTYLGWVGSSTYATVTSIRSQTCKYVNASGSTTLSDERLKKDFAALDKWGAFFDAIEPCAFKMKNGTSGRYHLGFKSQQIEEALLKSGLTSKDFAGFIKMPYKVDEDDPEGSAVYEAAGIKDGEDEYGLIYSEFIALNTYKIQQLQKENNELKNKVTDLEGRLAKLEALLTKG